MVDRCNISPWQLLDGVGPCMHLTSSWLLNQAYEEIRASFPHQFLKQSAFPVAREQGESGRRKGILLSHETTWGAHREEHVILASSKNRGLQKAGETPNGRQGRYVPNRLPK